MSVTQLQEVSNGMESDEILRLMALWDSMSKDLMVDKLNMVFDYDFPKAGRNKRGGFYPMLSYITQSSAFATESWTNKGRKDVRCPFPKWCQICSVFGLPLEGMCTEDNDWFTDEVKENVHKVVMRLKEEMDND